MNKKLNVAFVSKVGSPQSFRPKIEQKSNWYKDWEQAKEEREDAQLVRKKQKNEK